MPARSVLPSVGVTLSLSEAGLGGIYTIYSKLRRPAILHRYVDSIDSIDSVMAWPKQLQQVEPGSTEHDSS